ncbi:hypothetical protein [Pseudonocardia endophytica]|uniref:Uncharacterized protein n=1 Tax=Pseudonocardia endophytica TaxID=401976 RepID=A0A4R1HS21_PSEEN|nr:hypothetical protein [Pseudonocardia endophytica]TCK25434.1 hypothetical protein EV378_1242 [Pseudonocardia endophytica]
MSEQDSRSTLHVVLGGIIAALISSGTTIAVSETASTTALRQAEISADATRDAARITGDATVRAAEIAARAARGDQMSHR